MDGGNPTPNEQNILDLRASHVSSPRVSLMFSSTSMPVRGRPLATSVAVCRQRLSGDMIARVGRSAVILENHLPPYSIEFKDLASF
jgi:hypothetical protein